jgi:hypothetical protein
MMETAAHAEQRSFCKVRFMLGANASQILHQLGYTTKKVVVETPLTEQLVAFNITVHKSNDFVSFSILRSSSWEPQETMDLMVLLQSISDVVGYPVTLLDVGANIGSVRLRRPRSFSMNLGHTRFT